MDRAVLDTSLEKLEGEVEEFIGSATRDFQRHFESDGAIYVIKYLPPKRLGDFLASGKKLYASDVPGYTWGDGVYVAPVVAPFSTMMYGRVGLVGRIERGRVFDAVDFRGRNLYQRWIRFQWRWYDLLTLTLHSNLANRYLRNRFRTRFRLDCVYFHPDQFCPGYVSPQRDIWFVITHWKNGRVSSGMTSSVLDVEWCAVGCEEFAPDPKNLVFDPVLGPAYRGGRFSSAQVQDASPQMTTAVLNTYRRRRANPAAPVLLVRF